MALVGSESLLGPRNPRPRRRHPRRRFDLRLIAADEEQPGKLTLVGDEPALVGGLDADSLAGTRAPSSWPAPRNPAARPSNCSTGEPGAAIIDLTGAAEERPDARLRAPLVEAGSRGR